MGTELQRAKVNGIATRTRAIHTLSSHQLDRRITQVATSLFNVGFSSHRSGNSLSTSPNARESQPTPPGLLALLLTLVESCSAPRNQVDVSYSRLRSGTSTADPRRRWFSPVGGDNILRSTRVMSQIARIDGRSEAPAPSAAESGSMPELRSRACDTDFSLIDLPRIEPIDDPRAYLQAAIQWHFGPDTGSRYWLKRVEALDFNPTDQRQDLRGSVAVPQHRGRAARRRCS